MFVLAFGLACVHPAFAQAPVPSVLVVGSVRDQGGRPIAAQVEAEDVAGHPVGSDRTRSDGTFSIAVNGGAPAFVVVRCPFCAPARAPVSGEAPVIVIVRHYDRVAGDGLSARDVAALPYSEPGDVLALAPYVVPSSIGGTTVTDVSYLGLERGRSLILDDGVPAYDLASGASALADFPSRDADDVDSFGPERAFTYGSYAGGGTNALAPQHSTTIGVNTGLEPSFLLRAGAGPAFAGVAESQNADAVIRRRGDLGFDGDFAGGDLQANFADSAIVNDGASAAPDRNTALASISYATSSRHYRTFFSAGGASLQSSFVQGGGVLGTRASDLFASLRVEHPARVTVAYGALSERLTASYDAFFAGHVADDLAYVEASAGGARSSIDGGVSVSQIGTTRNLGLGDQQSDAQAALVSISGRTALGRWFSLRAAASTSLRVPTLGEASAEPSPANVLDLERGATSEFGLEYADFRRLRVGGVLAHEDLTGFGDRDTVSLGFSAAWQIAPLLSLRVWTLHNDVTQYGTPTIYSLMGPGPVGRCVLWTTYENSFGLRVDGIAHRDVYAGHAITNVDGDVLVPLVAKVQLSAGTYREGGLRRTSVGLRF
jgi:hypothetical protein